MRALARGNNGALLVRQIVNALMADNLIMTPDIGKYLKYLEDGGYIAFTARSVSAYNAYRKDAVVQLTKKGILLPTEMRLRTLSSFWSNPLIL